MTFDKAVDHYLSILERGCYVQFDLCGNQEYYRANVGSWWLPGDRERALAVKAICDHGYEDKILISTDIGHKYYMTEFGGWGYGHILNNFREFLMVAGLTEKQCDRITKDNPQKMLTIF